MKSNPLIAIVILALQLVFSTEPAAAPSGSNAGEIVAFVRKGNIWIARLDGSGQRQLTGSGRDTHPALSPDGKEVAFCRRTETEIYPDTGFGQLFMVETKGGTPRKVRFEGVLAAEDPAFSPDGKSLLFVGLSELRRAGKKGELQAFATMSITIGESRTGKCRPVVQRKNSMLDAGYIYSNPAFSPDGKSILWQESGSDVSGGFAIIDLNGKRLFRYPLKGSDFTPYWRPALSSDGHRILCYSPATTEAAVDTIHLINRRTQRKILVTSGTNPVFIRNGSAILFERGENRWSSNASSNLWLLALQPGAVAKQIITDASEPAAALPGNEHVNRIAE
ncbi:TolB family protein [Chlorobium ferrooxidans]|uniref:WD40-like Beta Propeller n=1 Tax=Chlorobium ferrooxidans DSM 13031 TaxID=377431 RepID=Q0YR88_9CHLB|nr:PD40 domain-containing protein [Chlorobium ferrooxidans]EAT58821.1 WD40-like Beta Propeller [Chlorobium ferrooxidans DSM 13031]